MKYCTHIWFPEMPKPVESRFISVTAEQYLADCENEVYDAWQAQFPSEKSLAGVMGRTVLARLESNGFTIASDISPGYGVYRAFHHRSSTSDLFVDVFERFHHQGISDFLIITQSEEFKHKFLYDSATMCFESVTRDYSDFVHALKLEIRPRLFILTLRGFSFKTDILHQGKKKFIKLDR